jgi:hypothetical protein
LKNNVKQLVNRAPVYVVLRLGQVGEKREDLELALAEKAMALVVAFGDAEKVARLVLVVL